MKKLLLLLVVITGLSLWAAPKADARVFVSIGLGGYPYYGYPYYGYPYAYGYGPGYGYYGGGYGYYPRYYRRGYYGPRGGYYYHRGRRYYRGGHYARR